MQFCRRCGARLPDDSLFCTKCGTPIVPADEEPAALVEPAAPTVPAGPSAPVEPTKPAAPAAPTAPVKPVEPAEPAVPVEPTKPAAPAAPTAPAGPAKKGMSGKTLGILAGCILLVVVVIAAVALIPKGGSGSAQRYELYTNDAVMFSIQYPEGCTVSEPYENTVLIENGSDFRVAVEYAYQTVAGDAYIYSADDFSELRGEIGDSVVTDFLGSDQAEITGFQGDVTDWPGTAFTFSLDQNGQPYSGCLYVHDGQGDFGVYCIQTLINDASDQADLYREQIDHIVESFAVTGAYTAPGYKLWTMETGYQYDKELYMITGDRLEPLSDDYKNSIILLKDGTGMFFFSADVKKTDYSSDYAPEQVLDEVCRKLYFDSDSVRDAEYISQISQFHRGRFDYWTVDLSSSLSSGYEPYTSTVAIADIGGTYWRICVRCHDDYDEYHDIALTTMNDILMSLSLYN